MAQPLVAVTGASSGIGRAVAAAFAKEGHPLLLLSRHIEALPELPDDTIVYARADVADYDAVERAIRGAEARHGPTECLVNSAGFADIRIDFGSGFVIAPGHAILAISPVANIGLNFQGYLADQ